MKKLSHRRGHVAARAPEYPLAPDALDAIYKGFEAMSNSGFVFPYETQQWMAACKAVKAKFPKDGKTNG